MLERARELKQALLDFVLEAEDELAEALEIYSAKQLAQFRQSDTQQQNLVIDRFLTEGTVGNQSPIDRFLTRHASDLSESDRQLLQSWHRSFLGLFAVTQILPDGFELMNWLTAKHYRVSLTNQQISEEMKRFKLGEILLTRISPVTETAWMFSGPWILMGNLGKPKLAVAIGNFKQNYKESLYSDAPDLLEEAWKSVERYHQDFLEFFGSDEVTMSGYELSKKIAEFQEILTQKQLAEAGIDDSKSLAEIAKEAGIDEDEFEDVAETMGVDTKTAATLLKSKETARKMMTPKVELPAELKKAESITVLADPRWGQMFLPNHTQFKSLLEAEDWQTIKGADSLIRKYLGDSTINSFVWHRLARDYPTKLESILKIVLERENFDIQTDLNLLLQEFGKPVEPELPEIASVPLHLHNLFQEALAEVNKSKPKGSDKKQAKKGFQRL